jgi:hypothetical protein
MDEEYYAVIVACYTIQESLSLWEKELLDKCAGRVLNGEGLTQAQKEKLHEVYVERFIEKIAATNWEEES